jgi:hypothetical protein
MKTPSRGVFDNETRKKPLAFAADAAGLWKLNGISVLSYYSKGRFLQFEYGVRLPLR